jgi:hypothetical protein
MPRPESLTHTCVELTAILSAASVASGRLATLSAGEVIEITPGAAIGAIVTLMVGGQTVARARLRPENDRLVATIIEVGDTRERPLDEWRFIKKDPSAASG